MIDSAGFLQWEDCALFQVREGKENDFLKSLRRKEEERPKSLLSYAGSEISIRHLSGREPGFGVKKM